MIVTELYTYPVKSLAGIRIDHACLLSTGFEFDRRWMVIEPNGAFITQRSCPQMSLIQTRLENHQLVLSTFGMEDIEVPSPNENDQRTTVGVWGDEVNAIIHDTHINSWLSDALGKECKLAYFPASETRACDPHVAQEGDSTLFADGFPLLLANQASLDDLNSRLSQPVGMERFRPNIVIGGQSPFEEDRWRRIEINGIALRFAQCCARCSVPTVNPETGIIEGPEPIRTLSEYRTGSDGEVYFGINMIPESVGILSIGNDVTVIRQS
ncbi:MAG: MOSC domain-containing protein [Gammaproteobacteria bacterium]|nr:MOSC domain-containing protein [Gammaproteobacteria bacterium]MCY4227317.1 MOSC domain-containing protein [Gammaproteobacteria bacterium]